MKCPVCAVELVMTQRDSVEIDYCPRCRGVWLDRGELDKIIARSARGHDDDYDDDDSGVRRLPNRGYERGYERRPDEPRRREKEGFFGRLFDFD